MISTKKTHHLLLNYLPHMLQRLISLVRAWACSILMIRNLHCLRRYPSPQIIAHLISQSHYDNLGDFPSNQGFYSTTLNLGNCLSPEHTAIREKSHVFPMRTLSSHFKRPLLFVSPIGRLLMYFICGKEIY